MCLAIPGKIIEIAESDDPIFRKGDVSIGGVMREVNLSMVPDAAVGDYVLVHVGVAINAIDEEEARETLKILKEAGAIGDDQAP
jgi:hydrogenase expression/formation protein HypC